MMSNEIVCQQRHDIMSLSCFMLGSAHAWPRRMSFHSGKRPRRIHGRVCFIWAPSVGGSPYWSPLSSLDRCVSFKNIEVYMTQPPHLGLMFSLMFSLQKSPCANPITLANVPQPPLFLSGASRCFPCRSCRCSRKFIAADPKRSRST